MCIPFQINKSLKRVRVYATAHGLYRLTVNGSRQDDWELAPENTTYHRDVIRALRSFVVAGTEVGGNVE